MANKKLIRNGISGIKILLISFTTYLLGYFFNLILAHHLSPADYGDFSVATRVLYITSLLVLAGTNISTKRFLPAFLEDKNQRQVNKYLIWNFQVLLKTFLICFFVALSSFLIVLGLHFFGIKKFETHHLAVYMLWIAPLAALVLALGSLIASHQRVLLSLILQDLAKKLFLLIFVIVGALLLNITINYKFILLTFAIVFLLLISSELYTLRNASLQIPLKQIFKKHQKTPESSQWKKTSYRIVFNNILFSIIGTADLFIVEIFHPAEHAVGHYAAMLTITGINYVIISGSLSFLKPKISTLIKTENGKQGLQKEWNFFSFMALILLMIITIFIFIFGKALLFHFGPTYVSVYWPLVILNLGIAVGALLDDSSATFLVYAGFEKYILQLNMIIVLLFFVITSFLTHYFGIMGTVIGTLTIPLFLKGSLLMLKAKKELKFNTFFFI